MAGNEQNVYKCPVVTLVQDNQDTETDYGRFLSATERHVIHARGRNVVIMDPTRPDVLRMIQTEEELKYARFVRFDGRKYKKDDVACGEISHILTVSHFGLLYRWAYSLEANSIQGVKLLDHHEAGQAPFFLDVLKGTNIFVLSDCKGRTQMHSSGRFSTVAKANVSFEKLINIKLLTDMSYVMLGRGRNGNTTVRVVEFDDRMAHSVTHTLLFNEKFRQCLPTAIMDMSLLIGPTNLKLVSFVNDQHYDFDDGSMASRRIVHAAPMTSNEKFFSFVFAEYNGKVIYARLRIVPETRQPSLHLIELDTLSYRPRSVFLCHRNRLIVTTKAGTTIQSKLTPMGSNWSYQRDMEYGADSKLHDIVISGVDGSTDMVTCSGEGVTGQIQIYRKSMTLDIHKILDLSNVDKIFAVRHQNTNYDTLLFFSTPTETLIYSTGPTDFLIPRTDINFSNCRTLYLGNFHNENSIVQVVEVSVVVIPLLADGLFGPWGLYQSSIGSIEHVDGDLPGGKVLFSSKNKIELMHFGLDVTNVPYLLKTAKSEFILPVACVSFFEKDSKFCYKEARYGLVGLRCSHEIHVIRLDTFALDTVQTILPPIFNPTSFVSHLDYFLVSDADGRVVKCHEFNKPTAGFFGVESTPRAQQLAATRHADATAIGLSDFPVVFMETNDVKHTRKLNLDCVVAAASMNVEMFGSMLVVSTGTEIRVGNLRLAHSVIALGETPIKLLYHNSSKSLAVVTEIPDMNDQTLKYHKINFLDGVTYTDLVSLPLSDTYIDICCGQFVGTNIDTLVYATGRPSGTFCLRFMRFDRAEKRTVDIREHPLITKPDSIHFESGYFYAAVSGEIFTFGVVGEEVKHIFTSLAPNGVTNVAVPADQILVAGASISMESIGTGSQAEGEGTYVGMATISESLVSTVDSEKNLSSFYIDEDEIRETRRNGNFGIEPRGRYWLGTSVRVMKSDRPLVQSAMIQPGGQVYFITDTGSVGCIAMLNSNWSKIIDDVVRVLQQIESEKQVTAIQSAMNRQRETTRSDFLDADLLRTLHPTRQSLNLALQRMKTERRRYWPNGYNNVRLTPALAEQLVEFCGLLSPI